MVLEMRLLHRENSGDVQSTAPHGPRSIQQSADQQVHVRTLLKVKEKTTKKDLRKQSL